MCFYDFIYRLRVQVSIASHWLMVSADTHKHEWLVGVVVLGPGIIKPLFATVCQ